MAGQNMSNAVETLNDYLNSARAHAMAEDTYVLVCFSLPAPTGHPDLQMISYSSLDGSYTPGSTPAVQSSKVVHLPNVSLISCATASVSSNLNSSVATKLSNSKITIDGINTVDGLVNISSAPSLPAPGSTATTGPTAFNELIAFSPQGEALLVPASGTTIGPSTPYYGQIFLGLCPAHNGTTVTSDPKSSALLVDGGTGHVVIYRP